MQREKGKINKLVAGAMKSLNGLIDVNTVIGKPIKQDNTTIIPVSKVTMGFITGGGEYGDIKVLKKDKTYPFGGGSGAVLSLKPYGFLIDGGDGFKLVKATGEPLDKIIDTATEFLEEDK